MLINIGLCGIYEALAAVPVIRSNGSVFGDIVAL